MLVDYPYYFCLNDNSNKYKTSASMEMWMYRVRNVEDFTKSIGSNLSSLNVSGCQKLEDLSCGSNKLSSLNVGYCKNLKELS